MAESVPILIVDDRPENLMAFEASLERFDYELVLAHSGREALSRLLEREFALVLLDVAMPELDGFETARLIRGRNRSRHTPIIFITASMTDASEIFHGYEQGAVDYLTKPVDVHALQRKVAVFADLFRTARKEQENAAALARAEHEARQRAEALYDVTFREAPIGIAHVSRELKWLRVNERMTAILRRAADELHEHALTEFVHPDDERAVVDAMRAVLGGEARRRVECRMLDGERQEVWTHLTFSLIRDPAGQPVQLALLEDITEERRLAEALRSSERRFARLRDSGLLGIYELDRDGVIVDANDAFLSMVGYAREELERRELTAAALVPREATNGIATFIEPSREGTTPTREVPFIRKDGSRGTMLAGAVASSTVVGFTLDLTVLHEAELLRARSARELEQSLRARDDFLSLLAHELRSPLTPLMLQLASLRATAAASVPTPIERGWLDRQLETLQRPVAKLAKLTEDFLEVSAASVGGFPLERVELDLVRLVRDVVALSRRELDHASCEVTLDAPEPVPGRWDRHALERVLNQLLANAMKYAAGRPIEVQVRGLDGEATLTVRDHGVGIPPQQEDVIFERFSRPAPVQNYGGFGLGLWLVRRIVAAHGGEIHATNAADGGAVFSIKLPRGAT